MKKGLEPLRIKISLFENQVNSILYYFLESRKNKSGREEKKHLVETDGRIKTFRDLKVNQGKPNEFLFRKYYKWELFIENSKYILFNFKRKVWGHYKEYENVNKQKYVLIINDLTLEEFEKIKKILKEVK